MNIRKWAAIPVAVVLESAAGQAITIVAREGRVYPTLPAGAVLENFMRDQFVAPDGSVAIHAYVTAPGGDRKVVVGVQPGGQPIILAQEGASAGGTPGLTFSFLNVPIALSGTRAAISAFLSGPGVTITSCRVRGPSIGTR